MSSIYNIAEVTNYLNTNVIRIGNKFGILIKRLPPLLQDIINKYTTVKERIEKSGLEDIQVINRKGNTYVITPALKDFDILIKEDLYYNQGIVARIKFKYERALMELVEKKLLDKKIRNRLVNYLVSFHRHIGTYAIDVQKYVSKGYTPPKDFSEKFNGDNIYYCIELKEGDLVLSHFVYGNISPILDGATHCNYKNYSFAFLLARYLLLQKFIEMSEIFIKTLEGICTK